MDDKVNILLVDDQPAKLLSYETILAGLGETLIKAASAREALEQLLKQDIAVILVDVCMPELDGFQLAAMIREHPRFQRTAIIFISAIHLTDVDRLRAYEMGAVDYVPVPVIPEVLRAKVKIFAELYRKTRQLEQLNRELERRVAERTAELEASTTGLVQSEQRRSLALAAGRMGSWDWDPVAGHFAWDDGQYRIFGVDPESFTLTIENIRALIHPDDWSHLQNAIKPTAQSSPAFQTEFRVIRPDGQLRWCIGTAVASVDATDHVVRISGVTVDITERRQAEEHQVLLAREVDHRARNVLAVAQAIVRLTDAETIDGYAEAIESRVGALARAHTLLSRSRWEGADLATVANEELAPYRSATVERATASGPATILGPIAAQSLALVLHELATNAVKYGALSVPTGRVALTWELTQDEITLRWTELGGPAPKQPERRGYGTRVINGTIDGQLGGKATFDWRPPGLCCTIVLPRSGSLLAQLPAKSTLAAARLGEPAQPVPFSGKRVLFYLFILGLMIPFFSVMIPLYYNLKDFGLLNTPMAVILPSIAGAGGVGLPLGIFLMRAFFLDIPGELADAARVDGCDEVGVFRRIMVPLALPGAASAATNPGFVTVPVTHLPDGSLLVKIGDDFNFGDWHNPQKF
jgi:PAS domain S-box-containing protein